jgi:hypothetical protein
MNRKGSPWSKEEEYRLEYMVENNLKWELIANIHQRTIGAVKARMVTIAIKKINDNILTLEEASKKYKIPTDILTDRNKQIIRNEKPVKEDISTPEIITFMNKMIDRMLNIEKELILIKNKSYT